MPDIDHDCNDDDDRFSLPQWERFALHATALSMIDAARADMIRRRALKAEAQRAEELLVSWAHGTDAHIIDTLFTE